MIYLFIPLVMSIAVIGVITYVHYVEKRDLHNRLASRNLDEYRYHTKVEPRLEAEEKAKAKATKKMSPEEAKRRAVARGY